LIFLFNSMSRKGSSNTNALANEEKKLLDELAKLEKQIYLLETSYLENTAQVGNLVRGWNEFLSSKPTNKNFQSPLKKIQNEDRIFSLSSATFKNYDIDSSAQNLKKKNRDFEDDSDVPQKRKKSNK